mmetsp:Transcript_146854/g.471510  ORF Transcript_146854/g.471510 Transcript_146854/m.471510 type:complete len:122 (-) Transcript_146854:102-467(-)
MRSSVCGEHCIVGIVSASSEKDRSGGMLDKLKSIVNGGPMKFGCLPSEKPTCASDIAKQYRFQLKNVYFFDDVKANVEYFQPTQMNARQVTCKRDPWKKDLGLLGATRAEASLTKGVHTCR